VQSEDPPGYGFGDAAIQISHSFRMAPRTTDGRPTVGGRLLVAITFRLGEELFAINVFKAREVLDLSHITRVPTAPGYLRGLRELCDHHGAYLILDEVICGFGRVGSWWAAERYGVEPDLVTFAKAVTSGYLPLGGVLVGQSVLEPLEADPSLMLRHGYTYSGHATACAVALANLDLVEKENLLAEAARLERTLDAELGRLEAHPLVHEVRRGTGALAAVQLDPAALATDPGLPQRVSLALREQGVLSRPLASGALQISPSFVTTDADVRLLAQAFTAVLAQA